MDLLFFFDHDCNSIGVDFMKGLKSGLRFNPNLAHLTQILDTFLPSSWTDLAQSFSDSWIVSVDSVLTFLGGLCVTNLPMCPMSLSLSTFWFPEFNTNTLPPIVFKLNRVVGHHLG